VVFGEVRQIDSMNNPWKWIALALASVLFALALFGILTLNLVLDIISSIISGFLGWIQLVWPKY
jgi:hypothetical protein